MVQHLPELIARRLETDGPIRVAVIGAGKFASMFLAQVPTSPHIEVVAIADLDVDRARAACHTVGWPHDMIADTVFTDDGTFAIEHDRTEVVIDATGNPAAGIRHARASIAHGRHIVMVNVEADVLAGPLLAREAREAGVVYAMAYGDQPALVAEMVDWARTCGFDVVCAGKGTRYMPDYHASTPDTVWPYFGMEPDEARAAGMNPQMFNSFVDGTKSSIEMAAIANACGLDAPDDGLLFPPCGDHELQTVLRPKSAGGVLARSGTVEVVSSLHRDGSEVERDLRWGVYAVFEAPNDYTARCFRQYGLRTDDSGRYAALYRPYHLIGLELGVSVVNAALRGEATGATRDWRADVVAIAKRDLKAGERLDGEGGYTVWGKIVPAPASARLKALPIGLAHDIALTRDVAQGDVVTLDAVGALGNTEAAAVRIQMERAFGAPA
ncbi:MAG: NAD(P)H-dependent oxidoreductase [Hyphomicrobiales bacterium]